MTATEAEWVAPDDPGPLLAFGRGRVTDRKSRLVAAACCRRAWAMPPPARGGRPTAGYGTPPRMKPMG